MVQDFAEALLGAEVDALCGAAYGERSPERSNRRNGYRERDWDTRRLDRAPGAEAAWGLLLPGPADAQLARHSGVAPLEASSGRTQRHRLDRGGNRQLNAALYRIAITQARYNPGARAYLERKRSEGKSKREALRCLKWLLVRVVFKT
jgi:Transposase IS116/IS110/IS902 family/Transposase, Mutator family